MEVKNAYGERKKFPSITFFLLLTGKSSFTSPVSYPQSIYRMTEILKLNMRFFVHIQDSKNYSQLQRITYNRMRNEFEAQHQMDRLGRILKYFSHAKVKVPYLSISVLSITNILIENSSYKHQPNLASLSNTWKIARKTNYQFRT